MIIHSNEQHMWACCLASFLYERLRMLSGNEEISDIFGRLSLGSEFLNSIPKLTMPTGELGMLLMTCQLFWIRLKISSSSIDTITTISSTLFDDGGICDFMMNPTFFDLSNSVESPQKIVELLFHHWRLAILSTKYDSSPKFVDLLAIEARIFVELQKDEHFDCEQILRERGRNMITYLGHSPCDELQLLWNFELEKLKSTESFLSRLDLLPSSAINMMLGWSVLGGASRQILLLYSVLKGGDPDMSYSNRRMAISSAVEHWLAQLCGSFISKAPIERRTGQVALYILDFMNSLEVMRHVILFEISSQLCRNWC